LETRAGKVGSGKVEERPSGRKKEIREREREERREAVLIYIALRSSGA